MPEFANLLGALPALGAGIGAATIPAQTQAMTAQRHGLLPGEQGAFSPQLLSAFQNAFGTAGNAINPANRLTYPALDAMGLYPGQRAGFDEAVRQATAQISGNMAGRGFIRPEDQGAIAGSAAQYVMPTFAPLIGQNMVNSVQGPETAAQNRMQQFIQALGAGTQAMGSQTAQQQFFPSFATTLGQALLNGGNLGAGGSLLGSGIESFLNKGGVNNLLDSIHGLLGQGENTFGDWLTRLFSNQATPIPAPLTSADIFSSALNDPFGPSAQAILGL